MAIIKLESPRWKYDTTNEEMILTFVEAPPDNEPDAVNWNPTRKAVIRIPVPLANIEVTPL